MTVTPEKLKKHAHDMRSPISVLQGYLDFKSQTPVEGDEREYLEALQICVERFVRVANELDRDGLCLEQKPCSDRVEESVGEDLSGKRPVLIVDDDSSLRLQWRIFFKNRACQTIEVKSGEELLGKKLDYRGIQHAIVDYNFEGSALNGFDVIEFLQQKGVERIYLCTGQHDEPEVKTRASQIGVVTVIPKPLNKKLCETIFGA